MSPVTLLAVAVVEIPVQDRHPSGALTFGSATARVKSGNSVTVEAAPLACQSLEQGCRSPVIAEPLAILVDARQNGWQTDGVGVEHRTTAVARKTEPVHIDDVDVAGTRGVSLFQDAGAFVGE